MAASKPRVPTGGELQILRVLWARGASTVRQIVEQMSGTGYTTALKLLQIMHKKGLVSRDETGHAHIYQSTFSQDELERLMARDLADRAFGGSASRLALQALSAKGASEEELAEIRKLLSRLEDDDT